MIQVNRIYLIFDPVHFLVDSNDRKYFIGSYFLQVFFVAVILLLAVWVQITPDHFSGLFAYINLVPMA